MKPIVGSSSDVISKKSVSGTVVRRCRTRFGNPTRPSGNTIADAEAEWLTGSSSMAGSGPDGLPAAATGAIYLK
jgi:hypothetical protein